MAIIDFLKTERDKFELRSALEVLKEFKSNESHNEWQVIDFCARAKLEQLEEYLEYLVNGKELADDTKRVIASQKS